MSDLIDARIAAIEIGLPVTRLWQMSLAGRFVEMIRADRGEYRLSRSEFDAWVESRKASAVQARAEMTRERVRAGER